MNTQALRGMPRRKALKRAQRRWAAWTAGLLVKVRLMADHQRTCEELVRLGYAEARARIYELYRRDRGVDEKLWLL